MKKQILTSEEIGRFCLALAHLLHAGISPADGLSLLAGDEDYAEDKERLEMMARQADEGLPLDVVFRNAGVFPDYVCNLIHVGIQTGHTEEAVAALARYYENRARLERQIRSALLYPCILAVILMAVVIILLVWVLPVFNEAYLHLGSSLTGLAGMLLTLGNGLRKAMPVLGILVVGICLAAAHPGLRQRFFRWVSSRYRRGAVQRQIEEARFAQALSLGLQSGMTAEQAVALADLWEGACAARYKACVDRLEQGAGLPAALRDSEMLSKADCRLLEAGFRSGSGEIVMEQIAQRLLEDSEAAAERQAASLEPVLVIVLAVLVGAILFSVMLPLMNIMSAIG